MSDTNKKTYHKKDEYFETSNCLDNIDFDDLVKYVADNRTLMVGRVIHSMPLMTVVCEYLKSKSTTIDCTFGDIDKIVAVIRNFDV